jgi:hypothetical protein
VLCDIPAVQPLRSSRSTVTSPIPEKPLTPFKTHLSCPMVICVGTWLRRITNHSPRAVDDARGMLMGSKGDWTPLSDIADELERNPHPLVEQFMRNQLHTAIRVPYEILNAYCHDNDKVGPNGGLVSKLKDALRYAHARRAQYAIVPVSMRLQKWVQGVTAHHMERGTVTAAVGG